MQERRNDIALGVPGRSNLTSLNRTDIRTCRSEGPGRPGTVVAPLKFAAPSTKDRSPGCAAEKAIAAMQR